MGNDKKKQQIMHFKARMYQRYGLALDNSHIERITTQIRSSKLWSKQSLRVSIYEVDLSVIWPEKKEIAFIAFDKQRKVPVTCLTKEMIV